MVKSLLLPKLTYVLCSLSSPPVSFMKKLKAVLFHFIWGGKVDRLKRLSICKPYTEGGLAMIEVNAYVEALKAAWVRRELKSCHSWTSLFQVIVAKGKCLWEMNKRSLFQLSKQVFNLFWAEVLTAYARLVGMIEVDICNMNRYGLWHSDMTKYKNDCNRGWWKKGLRYLSDIIDIHGRILTFEQIKQKY